MQIFAAAFYAQIMEEIEKYSEYDLEQLSYRILQQVAKSMSLPSNVKKMYLVQLIYAKTHRTAAELDGIIQRVRYERQMLSRSTGHAKRKGKKKMRLQATEVSSTNSACLSPPINLTPKRDYSPEMPNLRSVVKYGPRAPSPRNTSDRVLRSYNLKSYKRPNYSMINNSVVELVKSERASPKEKETKISIVSHEGRLPRLNVTARCLVRRVPPRSPHPATSRAPCPQDLQVASVDMHTQTSSCLMPPKRPRTLSGIYPIPRPEAPLKTNYEYIKSIGFRHTDGKISKIHALVQKPAPKITYGTYDDTDSYKNVEVTIQDIINSNIDSQTFTNPSVSEYMVTGSNVGSVQMPLSDVMPHPRMVYANSSEMNSFSVYYHKKIRAEQVRTKRSLPSLLGAPRSILAYSNRRLPHYNTPYKRCSDPTSDVTKPIYVEVGGEEENLTCGPSVPILRKVANEDRLPIADVHARDVTRGIFTQSHTGPKVPTPRKMSSEQRVPSDLFRDITHATHTQNDADNRGTPSLVDKMAGESLPVLSDVYSDAPRDVTHTTNTTGNAEEKASMLVVKKAGNEQCLPVLSDVYDDATCDITNNTPDNAEDNIPTPPKAANDQRLPTLDDVCSNVTETVKPPISEEERKNSQRLPNFSDVFSEAPRDVTRPVYDDGEVDEKQPTENTIPRKMANELRLPAISSVLCKLRSPSHVTRRLHPALGHYPDKVLGFPKWSLESVFVLKDASQPPPAARTDTHCVYSTDTITTAAQLPPVPVAPLPLHSTSLEPANPTTYRGTSDEVSRLCDFPFAEQDMTLRRYHEARSASNSSAGSQAPTIPEMVEDALEIISQDRDYMERIGMDVRMQCILCSWAGSKIILEYHLRKEHSTQIMQQDKNEWNVTYKLGSLVNQDLWLSHVCERDSTLYILSVKYEDPDCFMASLTTLSIADTEPKFGTITLYNKVSGEPFSWRGQIPQLPSNMPYENDPNCLRIELSKLELLPNSANLKLHNRELVLNSPSKVVVGPPELNDIHIIIFVKIQDI